MCFNPDVRKAKKIYMFCLLNRCLLLFVILVPLAGCSLTQRVALYDDVHRADHLFSEKNYELAAVKYHQLTDKYPESKTRQRMLMQLGLCYYNEQIQALQDAQDSYVAYLDQYPAGHYQDEATRNLQRIKTVRANRSQAIQSKQVKVADDISKLKAATKSDPYNAELFLKLGNAHWNLQQYDEAVQAYTQAMEIDAALQEHELIVNRMTIDSDGNTIILTPELRRELEREKNPLVIFDMHEYNSRLLYDTQAAREAYYNVLGKIRNQSSRLLDNVTVEVAFYNPNGDLLDVNEVTIGRMPPGGVRIFRARASSYTNIYNIQRYECSAHED